MAWPSIWSLSQKIFELGGDLDASLLWVLSSQASKGSAERYMGYRLQRGDYK